MALERDETRGPSWADVAELMVQLGATHKGKVVVEMGASGYNKRGMVYDLVFRRVRGRNDWYTVCYQTRHFPSHQARTVPGLLLQALWVLDNEITDYDDLPLLRPAQREEECPLPPIWP